MNETIIIRIRNESSFCVPVPPAATLLDKFLKTLTLIVLLILLIFKLIFVSRVNEFIPHIPCNLQVSYGSVLKSTVLLLRRKIQ